MNRRAFLHSAGGGAACAFLASAHAAPVPDAEDRPNILFILSDQQRWDTLGCYGDTMGRALGLTPNLDAMAGEGVRFQHAFTCQPVCGPTRSCLQTGLHATQTGCWRNDIALPLNAVTIPRLLRPAGYEVGYIGKWHLASSGEEPNHRTKPVPPEYRGGYDDYWLASDILEFTSHAYDGHMFDANMRRVDFPEGRYRVDALTDFALDYLRNRKRGKPFFLFLSFIEPHHQNDHNHFEGPRGSQERYREYPVPGDLADLEGDWREEMPDYLGCCAALDGAVGRLRRGLDALGLAENTLVVYTSDHGSHFCTRNSEYKRSCHDASIRVPMLACGPGFRGGLTVDSIVTLLDLPPTVLASAGVGVPAAMRGRPLQKLVSGPVDDWRDEAFVQISESQVGRALRTTRWKYSVHAPGKSGWEHSASDVYEEEFLYDLQNDPWERTNLVRESGYEPQRAELRARLRARMAEAEENLAEIRPAPPL